MPKLEQTIPTEVHSEESKSELLAAATDGEGLPA